MDAQNLLNLALNDKISSLHEKAKEAAHERVLAAIANITEEVVRRFTSAYKLAIVTALPVERDAVLCTASEWAKIDESIPGVVVYYKMQVRCSTGKSLTRKDAYGFKPLRRVG